MLHYHYLIVGGGMTAAAAVEGIREADSGSSIGLIGMETDRPYNRPPLTKGLWKGKPLESVWRKPEEKGATLHLGRRVEKLEPESKQVTDDQEPLEDPDAGSLILHNRPPGERFEFPAKEIVDAGFLELVRYGIHKAGGPLIEDSLEVIDAILKVNTPFGPCWRRYNHDGYGQRADGGPYKGWGKGRAWPLLTGERAHYDLASGRDVKPYIQALERFASKGGMLPEQVWDEPDRPEWGMYLGRSTGSAMPLMWAHAEYIKLLRSVHDGSPFDRIPAVADRYLKGRARKDLEIWKFNRRVQTVTAGRTLRVQVPVPFFLHWTLNKWENVKDTEAVSTPAVWIHYVDIHIPRRHRAPVRFTFYWPIGNRWEGRDFSVDVKELTHEED